MAKRTVIRIVDDIDGVELDEYETVRWSLDGKNYEFDTSPEHADEFRNTVATYIAASRSVGAPRLGRRPAGKPASDTKAIRAWANAN
ncbi:MAG: Lsr2 family protein, partial [Gordonia sp. (in: high G+C Gram-positive bacteria)]